MRASVLGGMVLVCALALAEGASAQAPWSVDVWLGDPDGVVVYDEPTQWVQIVLPGTYGINVIPDQMGTGRGDINRLFVDPNLGAVSVQIARPEWPSYVAGCRALGRVSSAPGTTLTLVNCMIDEDAGTLGAIAPDVIFGEFNVGDEIGPYGVNAGRLDGTLVCSELESLTTTVGANTFARVIVDAMIWGDVSIGAAAPGAKLAEFWVAATQGDVWIDAAVGYIGVGTIHDEFVTTGSVGTFWYTGSSQGAPVSTVSIGGNLLWGSVTGFKGSLTVGGNLQPNPPYNPISQLALGDLAADTTVSITGDALGDVFVGGPVAASTTISIGGDLAGAASLGDSTFAGTLAVGGDVLGDGRINAPALGVTEEGIISIGGHLQGTVALGDPDFAGTLHIDGDAAGRIYSSSGGVTPTGLIHVGGSVLDEIAIGQQIGEYNPAMLGQIIVDGDLESGIQLSGAFGGPGAGTGALVWIKGELGGYVTVDFDGYDAGQRWDPNATVRLGGANWAEYHQNQPGLALFEVTVCKGDMDNDSDVDYYDIDPLLLAFGDGEEYDSEHPGLSGSRLFHADIDCSGTVDFYDIDPFIARIGQPCSPECGGGDNMQGGGEGPQMQMMGGGAALIAAQLAASVSPENMPALLAAIEQLALNPPPNSAVDWSAVLAALAGM